MLFRPESEARPGPGSPPPLKSPKRASDDTRMFELEPALRRVIEMEGSDLHLKVPSPPLIRLHGRLEPPPKARPPAPIPRVWPARADPRHRPAHARGHRGGAREPARQGEGPR